MKQKTNYKPEILKIFKSIINDYPNMPVCTHLCMALSDYPIIENISDKQLVSILEEYKSTKDLDIAIQHDNNLDELMRESENLDIDSLYDDEDDY